MKFHDCNDKASSKIRPEKDAVMQWKTQYGNITTNVKVNIYITLPALPATNVVAWKCHVDDSTKGRYEMILSRDLLTKLVLNLKFSEHVMEEDDSPFTGSTAPMVDLGTYVCKELNTGKIKPE